MELIKIAKYSTNAQTLLFDFVADKPEACRFELPSIGRFNSITSLLAHCQGAEQRWLAWIAGTVQPPRYEDVGPKDIAGIRSDWQEQRRRTLSIIQGARAEELSRSLPFVLAHWDFKGEMTVEEIFFHVLSHESYHRAQCSMLLQHQSIDPPNFDYPFLKPS